MNKREKESLEKCVPEDEDDKSESTEESLPEKEEDKKQNAVKKEEKLLAKLRPVKKDKSLLTRFKEGVNFKAKIIGIEMVGESRGEQLCQEAFQRLKSMVKIMGEHKQRVILNISFEGIKIRDEKSGDIHHFHGVQTVSFICQDNSDNRAFGYIYRSLEDVHHFIAIKTEKAAFQVVTALGELFQSVLFISKKQVKDNENEKDTPAPVESPEMPVEEGEEAKEIEEPSQNEPDLLILVDMDDPLPPEQLKEDVPDVSQAEPFNLASDNSELSTLTFDPFDTSFWDSNPMDSFQDFSNSSTPPFEEAAPAKPAVIENKYAALSMNFGTNSSVFETNPFSNQPSSPPALSTGAMLFPPVQQQPAPKHSKTSLNTKDLFADLDPLSKSRSNSDSKDFFQSDKSSSNIRVPPNDFGSLFNVSNRENGFFAKESVFPNSFPMSNQFKNVSNSLNPFASANVATPTVSNPSFVSNPTASQTPNVSLISPAFSVPLKMPVNNSWSAFDTLNSSDINQSNPIPIPSRAETINSFQNFDSLSSLSRPSPKMDNIFDMSDISNISPRTTQSKGSFSSINESAIIKRERPRAKIGTPPIRPIILVADQISQTQKSLSQINSILSPSSKDSFFKNQNPFGDNFFATNKGFIQDHSH